MSIFDRDWRKGSRQIKYRFNRLLASTICANLGVLLTVIICLTIFDGARKLYALLGIAVLIVVDIIMGIFLAKIYSQYKIAFAEENENRDKND